MALIEKKYIKIYCGGKSDKKFQKQVLELLKLQNLKINTIMATIAQLTQKVDDLQAALDAEQQEILAAIAELETAVAELQALVADGGTQEQRQALADKLDAVKADLESTVEAEVPEDTTSTTTETTAEPAPEEPEDPEAPVEEDPFA